MTELSKSDDEEILEKFIKELCKIITLKQFNKYKTPIFKQSDVVRDVFNGQIINAKYKKIIQKKLNNKRKRDSLYILMIMANLI